MSSCSETVITELQLPLEKCTLEPDQHNFPIINLWQPLPSPTLYGIQTKTCLCLYNVTFYIFDLLSFLGLKKPSLTFRGLLTHPVLTGCLCMNGTDMYSLIIVTWSAPPQSFSWVPRYQPRNNWSS